MSLDGGMAKLTPLRYDDALQSVKRQPTARTTSAPDASLFPDVLAVSPTLQPFKGWSSGIAPLPIQVVTTGAPRCSATATRSAAASAVMAPPPATITGRSAPAS